jgi:hypothetical protein
MTGAGQVVYQHYLQLLNRHYHLQHEDAVTSDILTFLVEGVCKCYTINICNATSRRWWHDAAK